MFVNSTQSATQGAAAGQSSAASVDYNSFLKLLVAEMKNQDPTNPMDATQYVAQLASFSQVEQSVQLNQKLDQLLQTSGLAQAEAMIGRTITSADGETTGVVKQVKLFSDAVVAILTDGKEVPIGPGITVG